MEGPSGLNKTIGEVTKEFDMAVAMLATSRFCVTKDGFFGMVPRYTRPGDMIFTIRGDEQRAMFVVKGKAALDSFLVGRASLRPRYMECSRVPGPDFGRHCRGLSNKGTLPRSKLTSYKIFVSGAGNQANQ
jgi:hypothetical protein